MSILEVSGIKPPYQTALLTELVELIYMSPLTYSEQCDKHACSKDVNYSHGQ